MVKISSAFDTASTKSSSAPAPMTPAVRGVGVVAVILAGANTSVGSPRHRAPAKKNLRTAHSSPDFTPRLRRATYELSSYLFGISHKYGGRRRRNVVKNASAFSFITGLLRHSRTNKARPARVDFQPSAEHRAGHQQRRSGAPSVRMYRAITPV